MDLVKFFCVRFSERNVSSGSYYFVRGFSLRSEAVEFCSLLNRRFPMYDYRVLDLKQLNEIGILPF